jgi:hypothetical protein
MSCKRFIVCELRAGGRAVHDSWKVENARVVSRPCLLPSKLNRMATLCAECGCVLTAESAPALAADQPCPQCGSLKRTNTMNAEPGAYAHAGHDIGVEVIDYPTALVKEARKLLDSAEPVHHGLAVVLAHTACEVAVQRALSKAFAKRGVPDWEKPVLKQLNGYNLSNERNRNFYKALTGDNIGEKATAAGWWDDFAKSAERRNAVAHKGAKVTKADATASVDVAEKFVAHVML